MKELCWNSTISLPPVSDSSSGNERACSFVHLNKLATFLMANSNKKASYIDRSNAHQYKISDGITNGERRNGIRTGKPLYGSKTPRNVRTRNKPAYAGSSTFVKKQEANANDRTLCYIASRRKSLPNTTTAVSSSTTVLDLSSRNVIYDDENKNNGLFKSRKEIEQDDEEMLPQLTRRSENSLGQRDISSSSTAAQRRRHWSEQNRAAGLKMDSLPIRRSSVDYPSAGSLTQRNSCSAMFARSRFSKPDENPKSNFASEPQYNVNSARASTSIGRRKSTSSLQRPTNVPLSTLDVIDVVSRTNSNLAVDVVPRKLNSRHSLRSSNVYSPSSVASAERLSRFKQEAGLRRASLPNPIIRYQVDSKSPEFHKTIQEMKKVSSWNDLKQSAKISRSSVSISSSVKEPQTREVLQKIEEISPEEASGNAENALSHSNAADLNKKKLESTTNGNFAVEKKENESESEKPRDNALNVVTSSSLPVSDKSSEDPLETLSTAANDEVILFKNKNLEIGADYQSSSATSEEFKLLCIENEYDSDVINDSVVFKDDEDLCDDDLHDKRMIIWIKSVSTGNEAEQKTRTTPPPSPDPNTMESAIRVVYDGGKK